MTYFNSRSPVDRWGLALAIAIVVGEVALGLSPSADRTTWALENFPVFVLLPAAFWLQARWRLSHFVLTVLAVHAFVLMVGGHYSYAEVPFGYWLKDAFQLSRNPYDRIGHFFQGFTPALVLSEVLPRRTPLKPGWFSGAVIVSMCLAFSAFYELIEWASALILGQGADAFLGTQGDPWDTQWDMFMALVGSLTSLTLVHLTRREHQNVPGTSRSRRGGVRGRRARSGRRP